MIPTNRQSERGKKTNISYNSEPVLENIFDELDYSFFKKPYEEKVTNLWTYRSCVNWNLYGRFY